MAKGLTYKEMLELAKANYNKGGDVFCECWEESDYLRYVELFGPMTKPEALAWFRNERSIEDEQEALMMGW